MRFWRIFLETRNRGYTPPPKFRRPQTVPSGIDEHSVLESGISPRASSGRHKNQSKFSAGYTALEMIVVISIMVAITAFVLVGFGTLNNTVALNRASRELAVGLRRAQNMSLAVTINPALTWEVPRAFGVYFVLGGTGYTIFADRAELLPPNIFNIGDPTEFVSYTSFDRGVRIIEFRDINGDPFIPVGNTLHVLFSAPEADPNITDGEGNTDPTGLYDKIDIILQSSSGEKRIVTVRVSGQINIK